MTGFGKVAVAVAGIGTVGGGVGLGFHLLSSSNNPTVSTKLTSEGFELARTQEEWTALFTAHDKLKETNDPVFKDSSTNKKWQWLQAKCQEALNKEEKDNTNYLLARQWCVKETSIISILGKANYKILDSKNTTDDTTHWPNKVNALKLDEVAIKDLGITKGKDTVEKDDIKKQCTTIIETKTTAKDFNKKIELAKSWCSIPNTTN